MNIAIIGAVWLVGSFLVGSAIGRVLSFCARYDEPSEDVHMTWTVDGDDFDGEALRRVHGAEVGSE